MTVEAGVAIVAALAAGSVALLGFGLDSLIELTSASTILWLYTGSRDGSAAAERRAQQIVATCFAALALYLAFDAITTLAGGSHPDVSWPGAVVAAGAIVVMPLLARAKDRVAAQLGSGATAGDAAQSWPVQERARLAVGLRFWRWPRTRCVERGRSSRRRNQAAVSG
jgi:divalent metal cation (Fe/Co/Zn/Cd) transporter